MEGWRSGHWTLTSFTRLRLGSQEAGARRSTRMKSTSFPGTELATCTSTGQGVSLSHLSFATHLAYPTGCALPALLLPQGRPHHAGDPLLQPLMLTRPRPCPRPASPPPPLGVVQPRIQGLIKVSSLEASTKYRDIFTIFGD